MFQIICFFLATVLTKLLLQIVHVDNGHYLYLFPYELLTKIVSTMVLFNGPLRSFAVCCYFISINYFFSRFSEHESSFDVHFCCYILASTSDCSCKLDNVIAVLNYVQVVR